MKRNAACLLWVCLGLCACGDGSSDDGSSGADSNGATSNGTTSNGTTSNAPTSNGTTSDVVDGPPEGWFEFRTDMFTVPFGEEKYFCFAKTLEEDMVIDRLQYNSEPVVHHFLLARTLAPEPEGFAECPVFFKTSWVPLFATGTGDADLEMPEGYAHRLKKGDQIMIQLHLLNASVDEITSDVSINMRPAADADAKPVGIYAFGSNNVVLPPNKESDVMHECDIEVSEDVDIFAFFPHMHTLGKRMHFEVSRDGGAFETDYTVDDWDFDQQFVEPHPLKLKSGDRTRITCSYDNNTPEEVVFGDSSLDEMCYLVGFMTTREGLDGCIDLTTPDDMMGGTTDPPPEGVCGEDPPNALGIGTPCTNSGGECPEGMTCSADQGSAPEGTVGFCLSIGACEETADCGGGSAVCCAPAEGGGFINICLPDACRPANCALQN